MKKKTPPSKPINNTAPAQPAPAPVEPPVPPQPQLLANLRVADQFAHVYLQAGQLAVVLTVPGQPNVVHDVKSLLVLRELCDASIRATTSGFTTPRPKEG